MHRSRRTRRTRTPSLTGPVLITGARGFVGRTLTARLGERSAPADVDVTDPDAVAAAVRTTRPAAVVHLAARSAVGASWADAASAWHVNAVGTVVLLGAIRAEAPGARVVVVSSGEVYGAGERLPYTEDAPVAPLSPYGVSKAAAELAAEQAARAEGLDVVVARPFTHIGPGQGERFAIGSWTAQIARLEASGGGSLVVGDLSVRRDLLDVRDVCRAYELLLDPAVPAGTYNVATASPVALRDVVERLVALATVPVEVEVDPERLRPVDVPVQSGDASRLRRETGWSPTISLDETLADMLASARNRVNRATIG